MAFKKTVEFKVSNQLVTPKGACEIGMSAQNIPCYLKITNLTGGKDVLTIQLTTYDFLERETEYDIQTFVFVPSVDDNSENFIKQGYEYLKILPEFADAIDILET